MVEQRTSIIAASKVLAELVLEGGSITSAHKQAATRLLGLCKGKGVYERQYQSHEERVLYRHLNLYKNKLAKAVTPAEKNRWTAKVEEQEAKISSQNGTLDLDDL